MIKQESIEAELIQFILSPEFKVFEKIMENMHIARVLAFQNNKENSEVEMLKDKISMNVYMNLPNTLRIMADQVIDRRRLDEEKS